MTMEECYSRAGGDYREVLERIGSEARVQKYLGKFLNDKSYGGILSALEEGNGPEVFACAHNLKGLCGNLSLKRAGQAAGDLCEAFRNGAEPAPEVVLLLRRELKEAYEGTEGALKEYLDGK